MSHIIHLKPLKELKEELKRYPERLEFYRKVDIYTGRQESIEFLLKKLKKKT